jgi:hypothetical protein
MKAQASRLPFKRPTIVSSTSSGVRLWTHDGDLPVNIVVKRRAIDDCFGLTGDATNEFRWEIIAGNLDVISQIAAERHARRLWELVPGPSEDYRLIELGYEHLKSAELKPLEKR